MYITIWRHGQAGQALRDSDRELTPQGREEVAFGLKCYVDALARYEIPSPTRLLYSRWRRTAQTMDILATGLRGRPEMAECLIPGCSPLDVEAALDSGPSGDDEHLLLVSHQPLVSRLADALLDSPGLVPGLSPGGLVCLQAPQLARGLAGLRFWMLPPGYEACQ